MKLSDIGEFGLIHRIAPRFLNGVSGDVRGIGDDCAVIPGQNGDSLLITTDMLIENIHFLRNKTSPWDLGHKSLAVNLSDIAGMGGYPTAAFLSIGLPKDISLQWLDDFFEGIQALSSKWTTPLLGGDIAKSKQDIVINIAVIGRAQPGKIKYRSNARIEDVICVTGVLGDSGGGLNIMLNDLEDAADPHIQQLVHAHNHPVPHLKEGQWLAEQAGIHAMMDVSDGIDSDIKRIMEQSDIGARIEIANIPISESLTTVSDRYGWNAVEIAVSGGEDFCLMCTVDRKSCEEIAKNFASHFGNPLYQIGTIEAGNSLEYYQNSRKLEFTKQGWDHFKL